MAKDKIKLLSQKVANQIAAGEVVAHPASVVKEMMENAIDAGATEVIVNFRKAGYELIQIVDNGVGMTPNDSRMAFERHATSKIKKADDIYSLNTFGFRGEALASIAAVAKVEVKSRTEDAEMGCVTIFESGECKGQSSEMCNKGSQFMVRDIFQDTPARRRFMEKESKSSTQIMREFRRVALCYPQISFELYSDGATAYHLSQTTLHNRIVEIAGRSAKSTLLEVSAKTTIVNIHGYIGNEKSARTRNQDQYLFVNGRYFESKYLVAAILKGYEKIIKAPQQPSFFLYFEVTPDNVDVNIHPQKIDVKFAEESSIWNILLATVRETLARTGVVSMMDFDESSDIEIPIVEQGRVYDVPRAISNEHYNPFEIEIETKLPKDEMDMTSGIAIESSGSAIEFETFESQHSSPAHTTTSAPSYHAAPHHTASHNGASHHSAPRHTPNSMGMMSLHENLDHSWESGFDEYESQIESSELPLNKVQSSSNNESDAIVVGNITVTNSRYAWCKISGNMSVVDLKRAKERVLYEYYISSISGGESASQRTFFPLDEVLSSDEYTLLRENIVEFERSGFEIEFIENNCIRVVAMPAGLKDSAAIDLIHEILQLLASPEDVGESRRDKIAMVMAKSGSNSLGRSVSVAQACELVSQLLNCKMSGMTADGRRIIWEITPDDIKRRLK